jgi:hypothetical protein
MPEQSPSQSIRMTKDAPTIRNALIARLIAAKLAASATEGKAVICSCLQP